MILEARSDDGMMFLFVDYVPAIIIIATRWGDL
jgi:hypothetical protein